MRLTDASSSPRSLEPRTLTRLLRRAILPPLLLLTVLVAVLLWQVNTLVQAHRAVEHSNRVIAQVDQLGDQLLAIQSALRAYAVTGAAERLEDYDRGLLTLDSGYQRLLDNVADNAAQRRRVQDIHPLIVRWQHFAETN